MKKKKSNLGGRFLAFFFKRAVPLFLLEPLLSLSAQKTVKALRRGDMQDCQGLAMYNHLPTEEPRGVLYLFLLFEVL
jgi:hypothetical protein